MKQLTVRDNNMNLEVKSKFGLRDRKNEGSFAHTKTNMELTESESLLESSRKRKERKEM